MLLVFNAGSSNLKFALFDDTTSAVKTSGQLELGDREISAVVDDVLAALKAGGVSLGSVDRLGHRVVHGGARFQSSVVIDDSVEREIEALVELAPLHNPVALALIRAAQRTFPKAKHIAVFDTAFYRSLPLEQAVYPLPYDWYERWGVRRYGFHGISHAHALERAADLLHRDVATLNLISCHLGNGCSLTGVKNGRAVATTMGFTPLDGVMMGTRPGSLDPGIFPYLHKKHGLSVDDFDRAINQDAGLAGVSGLGRDVRALEKARDEGNQRARLALTMFATHVRAAIGALAVTLGRFDALVFTGGIGEGSASMRAEIGDGLGCLNVTLDPVKNARGGRDVDVKSDGPSVPVLLVHADEELMIAREARSL
jgi:acetate kinase